MRNPFKLGILLVRIACFASMPGAQAQVSMTEVQVAGRALSFLQHAPPDGSRIAIVYNPLRAGSVKNGQELLTMMAGGFLVGNRMLKPVLLPITLAAGAKAAVLFLAPDADTEGEAVALVAHSQDIPCVTTDIPQVQAGHCAVGVRVSPRVEVIVNHEAAAQSGTVFSAVFRMLIKEI